MKNTIWGLIVLNVAMMFVIARAVNVYLIWSLVASLVLANIFILFAFRRRFSGKTVSPSWAPVMPGWLGWTVYIPVVGGSVCILIGVIELAWKPCVIGFVAIAVGGWRIWANDQVRRSFKIDNDKRS
jgi:hypothetical protein